MVLEMQDPETCATRVKINSLLLCVHEKCQDTLCLIMTSNNEQEVACRTTTFSLEGQGLSPVPRLRGEQDQEAPEEDRGSWGGHCPGRAQHPTLEHKAMPPAPQNAAKAASWARQDHQGSIQKGLPSSACIE